MGPLVLAVATLTAIIAPATAAGTSGLSSPGCTNFGDTFVYTNPDYTLVRQLLSFPQIGLNNTLSNLTSPATLFAPNNEAFTTYNTAANITHTEALSSPLLAGFAQLLVVPEALLTTTDFHNGESLPTFLEGQNVTVIFQQVNTTEVITIQSPGSAGHILTPPNYACNLVIYGLSGILVPQVDLQDQDSPAAVHNITQYIETVLIPGGPVTSLNTVLTAVNNGELDQVAAGFNTAVAHNYTSQIIAVVMEAIGVPNAVSTLARIANEMIIQTNCSALQPLLHDLYPALYSTPQSLDLNSSQLSAIPIEAPRLAQCALHGT